MRRVDPSGQYAGMYDITGSGRRAAENLWKSKSGDKGYTTKITAKGGRLQYGYIATWVAESKNNWDYKNNHAELQLLENSLEKLLAKYGIDAWRTGNKHMSKKRMYGKAIVVTDVGFFWNTDYNLKNLENMKEWEYVGRKSRKSYNPYADEVLIYVPGYIGDNRIQPDWAAVHERTSHVIGVARTLYMTLAQAEKLSTLAHEVLHHFLQDDIGPEGNKNMHDSIGVMKNEMSAELRLGCETVNALLRAGVNRDQIDPKYTIWGSVP